MSVLSNEISSQFNEILRKDRHAQPLYAFVHPVTLRTLDERTDMFIHWRSMSHSLGDTTLESVRAIHNFNITPHPYCPEGKVILMTTTEAETLVKFGWLLEGFAEEKYAEKMRRSRDLEWFARKIPKEGTSP